MGGGGGETLGAGGGGSYPLSPYTLNYHNAPCLAIHTHTSTVYGGRGGEGRKEGRKGRGTRIRGQEEQDIKILNKKWGTGKDEERGYRGGGEERGRSGDFVTLPHFFFETLA